MRCPKCQHENSKEEIFCEQCDHRLDLPYRGERRTVFPPRQAAFMAIALGAVAVLFYFVTDMWYAPAAVGAVGIVLGTYALRILRSIKEDDRTLMMIIAGAGVAMSALGFILGIGMYS